MIDIIGIRSQKRPTGNVHKISLYLGPQPTRLWRQLFGQRQNPVDRLYEKKEDIWVSNRLICFKSFMWTSRKRKRERLTQGNLLSVRVPLPMLNNIRPPLLKIASLNFITYHTHSRPWIGFLFLKFKSSIFGKIGTKVTKKTNRPWGSILNHVIDCSFSVIWTLWRINAKNALMTGDATFKYVYKLFFYVCYKYKRKLFQTAVYN